MTRIAHATSASIGQILPATLRRIRQGQGSTPARGEHAVHHTVAATRPPGTVSRLADATLGNGRDCALSCRKSVGRLLMARSRAALSIRLADL
jgi:hypothetical protein